MRTALVGAGLGVGWFLSLAIAVEVMTGVLAGTTLSAFTFLLTRFCVYFAIGLGGTLVSCRSAPGLKVPLLVVVLLIVAERTTFQYEIYKFTMLSVLNLTIDYVGFVLGVFLGWLVSRRRSPSPTAPT
jgi:hypothetical protein